MKNPRRQFLLVAPALVATAWTVALRAQEKAPPPPGVRQAPPKPPTLPPDKVQSVVGQSHRSLDAVRTLVDETPLLVNACWDWGGGDFETPLEAAAHTGRREIAEFLLSRGARPSVYAAAMLGQLDAIKAVLALNPVAHEVPGPHGFTLLHCAQQGAEKAKPVCDFLVAHGAPEVFQRELPYKWPLGTRPAWSRACTTTKRGPSPTMRSSAVTSPICRRAPSADRSSSPAGPWNRATRRSAW